MKALQCQYPLWLAPEDDPHGEPRLTWPGKMRIVRSARRMHELRRRGVRLLHLGMGDGTLAQQPIENGIYGAGTRVPFGPWAWFETEISYERRAEARRSKRLLRRAIREAKAQAKLGWVDTLLRSLGPSYTELGYGWPALLDVLVPQVATGKMLDEICKIPWDADAEHVAKLKAELKAQSDAGMHYDDCDCWGCVPE